MQQLDKLIWAWKRWRLPKTQYDNALMRKATQIALQDWARQIWRETMPDGSVIWLAMNPEIPGCRTHSEISRDHALEMLADARFELIYHDLEHGLPLPKRTLPFGTIESMTLGVTF